jgi:hypothetical protein
VFSGVVLGSSVDSFVCGAADGWCWYSAALRAAADEAQPERRLVNMDTYSVLDDHLDPETEMAAWFCSGMSRSEVRLGDGSPRAGSLGCRRHSDSTHTHTSPTPVHVLYPPLLRSQSATSCVAWSQSMRGASAETRPFLTGDLSLGWPRPRPRALHTHCGAQTRTSHRTTTPSVDTHYLSLAHSGPHVHALST